VSKANRWFFLTMSSALVALSGCLTDPEEARYPTAEPEPEPEPPPRVLEAPPPAAKTCTGGTRRAQDGLIDDLEDGDGRAAPMGGRNGYWWVAKADHALVTTPQGSFSSSEGGVEGSKKAVRFAGKTDARDQWGAAVGLSFLESNGFYDASKYAGVAFRIRATKPDLSVRLKFPDVSSHPDGGLCKSECWNSFGKDLVVGTEWQEVVVTFSELGQQPNWGNPRPPAISVEKIRNIEWAVNQGVEFDVVVDDIHFIECA
jgi:hypothetical protein